MSIRGSALNNKMDVVEKQVEYKPLCPVNLSKITDPATLSILPLKIGEYNAPNKKHVVVRGYTDYYGGYAYHTREFVYALSETGLACINVSPIKSPIDIDPIEKSKIEHYIYNSAIQMDKAVFVVIAGPGHFQKKMLPENNRVIAWTMIETLQWSQECVAWLENADEIWCPTEVDVRRAKDAKLKNYHLIPLGFDKNLYHPHVNPACVVGTKGKYVFGVVGSWNERKGVKDIVRAFCGAFRGRSDVALLLVCKYGNRPYGEFKDVPGCWTIEHDLDCISKEMGFKHRNDMPLIGVIDVPLHPAVMPSICARIDCLVGFSRGESTWLPGLEFAGMKKPIIQVKNECCGYMDYLKDNLYMTENCKYKECDEALYLGTSDYYKDGVMGYGEVEELSDMMKTVMREQGTMKQIDNSERLFHLVEARTWNVSAQKALSRM